MKDLSLVIPVFNESNSLAHSLETILAEVVAIEEVQTFEAIIVDDGSEDNTWELLNKELCPRFSELRALRLSRHFGKESALCAGLECTSGKAVVVLDADLQHPPALIGEMYRIWREEPADVVEAVKRSRGEESIFSRLAARSFYAMFSNLSGVNLRNASDFKLMDRRVVDAWKMLPERNTFFRGMSAWLGFSRRQVEFDVEPRAGSRSKWSAFSLIGLALRSIAAYSSAPLQVVTAGGTVFILFSIILGIQTLYHYFTGVAVSGFTTVILLLLLVGGGIMVSLGIIGEYLAMIYDEVKARPRYLVAEDSAKADSKES